MIGTASYCDVSRVGEFRCDKLMRRVMIVVVCKSCADLAYAARDVIYSVHLAAVGYSAYIRLIRVIVAVNLEMAVYPANSAAHVIAARNVARVGNIAYIERASEPYFSYDAAYVVGVCRRDSARIARA